MHGGNLHSALPVTTHDIRELVHIMGQRFCVAWAAVLIVFLLHSRWPSNGVRGVAGGLTADNSPLVREALRWIRRYFLPLGGLVGSGGPVQRSTNGSGPSLTATAGADRRFSPLAADISVCHPSLTDANRPIYCCPPRRDADQTLVDFEPPHVGSSPLRIRRPAHLVDGEYIAKYERAVAIMKSLPSDHPHNFLSQANNHCLYCTGSYDQVNSTSLFKIHRSWLFFPWHRAFIYFYERILGKFIGDDSFALPYWNWDVPEGMAIPGLYMTRVLNHTARESTHLPPQVGDLNYRRVESGLDPEAQVATNLAFMYHQMVSGARKAELFMGCKLRAGPAGYCNGPGTVESAPHNTMHAWVGSGRNPEREDMGAFYSAARDPIFYAHHANIDRLWTVWKRLPGHNSEFTDPEWLDTSFTFYDENLRFVRIKVRDVLNPEKLGYTYEEASLPWLDARPKPAVPPEVARAVLKNRDEATMLRSPAASGVLSDDFGPRGRVIERTITTMVRRPKRNRRQGVEKAAEEEEVLVVFGIQTKRDKHATFDVFVNLVADEAVAGPRSTEFAGTFVNLPRGARRGDEKASGGGAAEEAKVTMKLGISELVEDLGAGEDESLWVSLVPRGGSGRDITVDGVRIEYMR